MNHQAIKDKLYVYHDPEFPEVERQEITAHLLSCEECNGIVNQWKNISSAFNHTPYPEVSESFVSQVMGKISALEKKELVEAVGWSIPKWLLPTLGYGFALALMFLAITHQESNVSAETVLLADVPQSSSWTFLPETPDMNQLMEASREGL